MNKKIVWMVLSGLMALSLVMAACGPGEEEDEGGEVVEEEVVAKDMPKYGGTVTLALSRDVRGWDNIVGPATTPGAVFSHTNEPMWMGDWAKGNAGGYGTNESDWADNYDIYDHKAGAMAESWEWTVDESTNEGTLVYQIRSGVHFVVNSEPWAEASRLVNGREITADDVVYSLTQMVTDPRAYVYKCCPEVRGAQVTKTGPWEVTVKLPVEGLITAVARLGNYGRVVPQEVVEKYGDMSDWKVSVGSGPFYLKDYVPGSSANLVRNPDHWGKDPIGPGKGNQLPYIDGFTYLIIPDLSTRQAALRTGQIDQMTSVSWEDAALFRQQAPKLLEHTGSVGGGPGSATIRMRTDKKPFDDIRVRRAMMMATDFDTINEGLLDGLGHVPTFPHANVKGYEALYLGLDDPETPESVRELYTYNPEKAKELLAEAGYPDGFKTEMLMDSSQVDYMSIIKDMWAKVGIDLALDVKERGVVNSVRQKRTHEAMDNMWGGPISIFFMGIAISGEGVANQSMTDDPYINEALVKVRQAAVKDLSAGMREYKELMKYVLDQVYAIPTPYLYNYIFYWPWLKNYSGERTIGYFRTDYWANYIWVDQELKSSMGY